MSGRRKLLLVGLAVLLVVLFVVAVGAGRGDRGGPDDDGAVRWLGRLVGDSATVDPATVKAGCDRTGDTLTVVSACVLRVADPDGLRTLVLRSPSPFHRAGARDAGFTVDDEVEPAEDGTAVAKVAVDRASEITVGCAGGVACAVTIGS
ncbi:hypothetical protein [Micromonospora sp. 4G55]|uniref:hypothetical protein n=1 Tax=Micromonospora sp. 4G55 TaxID=2806102 RepID=UPI001A46C6EE|nr:hypothetical protein [Micromonospora sp. 4G55]MBM0259847.1 hypothetical protein [Micromonospora sp. 4G55]